MDLVDAEENITGRESMGRARHTTAATVDKVEGSIAASGQSAVSGQCCGGQAEEQLPTPNSQLPTPNSSTSDKRDQIWFVVERTRTNTDPQAPALLKFSARNTVETRDTETDTELTNSLHNRNRLSAQLQNFATYKNLCRKKNEKRNQQHSDSSSAWPSNEQPQQ